MRFELALKGEFGPIATIDTLNAFFQMIEPVAERQTGPACFNNFKQPNGYDILRPWVFGLILLGGMIKDVGKTKDLLTGLGIDIVIKGQ